MRRFVATIVTAGALVLGTAGCLAAAATAVGAPKGERPPKGGGVTQTQSTVYEQPVWFEWEKGALDVLIVPPNHGQLVNGNGVLNGGDPNELNPCTNSYVTAIRDSIADWRTAVNTFASTGLKSTLVTRDYLVGCESVPQEALQEPEIVIVTDETKAVILGFALSTRPCLVDNSKLFVTSFTEEDMYNVNGQEYGHCLGLEHVEYDGPSDGVLEDDVMWGTYEQNPGDAGNHRLCPSNLNVAGLELVFGSLFGGPSGGTATLAPAEYQKISC